MHWDGYQCCFLWVHGEVVSVLATSDPLAQMTQLTLILRQLPYQQLDGVSFIQSK